MNDQERIQQLEITNRELSLQLVQAEKSRMLGTIASGVANHFNNLLSVILGYSSFILNREQLTPDAENALQKISEAAQRGRRLTNEIMVFSGDSQDTEQMQHVHEIVSSILSLLELHTSGQIVVSKQLSAASDQVMAQRNALHQVIFNLLTNAIDSMPTGGSLTVKTSNLTMPCDEVTQEFLRLEIEDSSGLNTGTAPNDTDTSTRDPAGLKLTNTYSMVGKMDGTLLMSSTPGDASRVEILLPVQAGTETQQTTQNATSTLTPSTIWVVDDNVTFREMCNIVLSDEKHQIEKWACGEDFQQAWTEKENKPDLVIIDFSMPDYNGLELREWLEEQGNAVPVIIVSGLSIDTPDIKETLHFKRTHFLQKPFASSELVDIVNVALGETFLSSKAYS